jgi:rhamnose utilization protein RhaD (predicted bifunctional aldolase and dehydrogenase)
MNDALAIESFVALSRTYGADLMQVQGAGGNTSVKLSNGLMRVKASGFRVSDITAFDGYVDVPLEPLQNYLRSARDFGTLNQAADDELAAAVDALVTKTPQATKENHKASIEAAMHGLFSKFVVHLHPAELNIILCSNQPEPLLQEIFSGVDHVLIPDVPPGYYLAKAISDAVRGDWQKLPAVIFLKSHGLIVHNNDPKEVERLLDNVTATIARWLDERSHQRKRFSAHWPWESEVGQPAIFPDTVVFQNHAKKINELEPKKAAAIRETFAASDYMRHEIKSMGLQPSYLTQDVCNYILNMGREKHRQAAYDVAKKEC